MTNRTATRQHHRRARPSMRARRAVRLGLPLVRRARTAAEAAAGEAAVRAAIFCLVALVLLWVGTARTTVAVRAAVIGSLLSARNWWISGSDDAAVLRRQRWKAYGLPAAFVAAAMQTWFSFGKVVMGGDIPPPIYTANRIQAFWAWDHQTTGAGSLSYQLIRAPEDLFVALAAVLGAGPGVGQRLFMTIVGVAAVLGAVCFARLFSRSLIVSSVTGVLAAFNPFFQTQTPNPLLPIAMGATGLFVGLIGRRAQGRTVRAWHLALASAMAFPLAANPPLLAVVIICCVGALLLARPLFGASSGRPAWGLVLRALPLAAVVNLWWAVPTVATLLLSSGTEVTAVLDVQAWSWTHARATVANVLTLNTAWSWDQSIYHPFAAGVEQAVGPIKYILPVTALAAVLLIGRRPGHRQIRTLLAVLAVLVFIAKGVNQPLPQVNLFLYEHVPGFFLFRDPMSKFCIPLILCMGVLAGTTVHLTYERWQTRRRMTNAATGPVLRGAAPRAVAALWVVSMFAYSTPMVTGAVVFDERPQFPGMRVALPADWMAAGQWLNRDVSTSADGLSTGKVVILPLNDYYQIPVKWGSYGVDLLPRAISKRPVVHRLPGGYISDGSGFNALAEALQTAALTGDRQAIAPLMTALGATDLVIRHDIDDYLPDRSFADPVQLETGLRGAPGLSLTKSFGDTVKIYSLTAATAVPVATAATNVTVLQHAQPLRSRRTQPDPAADRALASAQMAAAVASLPEGSAVVDPSADLGDLVASQAVVASPASSSSAQFRLNESQTMTFLQRSRSTPRYTSSVEHGPAGTVVRFRHDEQFLVDDRPLPARPDVTLKVDGSVVTGVVVNGQEHRVGQTVELPAGSTVQVLGVDPAVVLGEAQPLGDCHRYDSRPLAAGGGALLALNGADVPGGSGVELRAPFHAACTQLAVPGVSAGMKVTLSLQHRSVSGAPARICLAQRRGDGTEECLNAQPLESSRSWQQHQETVTVGADATGLTLYLYADERPGGRGMTVTQYAQAGVSAAKVVASEVVEPAPPAAVDLTLQPGLHVVRVVSSAAEPVVGEIELPVGDCHRYDDAPASQTQLSARVDSTGDVVTLSARKHSACVSAPLLNSARSSEPLAAGRYIFHADYRTASGSPARLCLHQTGPVECVALPAMPTSDRWQSVEVPFEVTVDSPGARVVLYADEPTGSEQTLTQYARLRISQEPTARVVGRSAVAESPGASVQARPRNPARYDLAVTSLTGTTAVLLNESYTPLWQAVAARRGTTAPSVRHLQANGYANVFVVEGLTPAVRTELRVDNPTVLTIRKVTLLSLTGLLLLVLVACRRWHRSTTGSAATAAALAALARLAGWVAVRADRAACRARRSSLR